MTQKHTPLTTSYPYPWALCYYDRGTVGKARPTILCFIQSTVAKDGEIIGYKTYSMYRQGLCKTPIFRAADEIAHFFTVRRFEQPDRNRINRARAELNRQWRRLIAKATGA